jgi:hypothetical protein
MHGAKIEHEAEAAATPAACSFVMSPRISCTSALASRARLRAARRAFPTISTPVTCQPRAASFTAQMPVPQPRSSAGPNGDARPASSRSNSVEI